MIEFINIEESKEYLQRNREIIEKILITEDIPYSIKDYCDIDKNQINKDHYKIYIINCNSKTLKIMNYIRNELNDWTSMILITTNNINENLKNKRIMPVDIILKDKNYIFNLSNCIQIALNNYNNRPNSLKYNYKNIYYNINLSEIIYIEKEKDNKRCIINTKNNKYPILGNLPVIEKKLDKRFIKSSRSYLINMEQVQYYNTKDNIIVFKDGTELYEISRNKKRSIINYLRGIN